MPVSTINITCLLSFLVATCALQDIKMTLTGLQQCRVAIVNSLRRCLFLSRHAPREGALHDETKGLRDTAALFPFEPACARFSFNVDERKDRWAAEKEVSDRRLALPSPYVAFAPVFSIRFFLLTWILKQATLELTKPPLVCYTAAFSVVTQH